LNPKLVGFNLKSQICNLKFLRYWLIFNSLGQYYDSAESDI